MLTTTELQPGSLFAGDFVVERLLGKGGMGAVYVVLQRSTRVHRALKLMRPELLADPKLRARFESEATVGADIASEHVVKVLLAGFDGATGMPYLVMELLEGDNLEDIVLRRGAIPWGEARLIFQQLCHGLGGAHVKNIVHRDLKPENVFIANSNRADVPFTVKVLDFGIAKVMAEAVKTAATQSLGTPLFMSPEQADPRSQVAPSTDVWALGLVAFRVLTGRFYWLSANYEGASLQALLAEVLTAQMAPPSYRLAELQVPVALPPGFDQWFLTCVNRDRTQRFPTANEAWQGLAQVFDAAGNQPAVGAAPYPAPAAMPSQATPGAYVPPTQASGWGPTPGTPGGYTAVPPTQMSQSSPYGPPPTPVGYAPAGGSLRAARGGRAGARRLCPGPGALYAAYGPDPAGLCASGCGSGDVGICDPGHGANAEWRLPALAQTDSIGIWAGPGCCRPRFCRRNGAADIAPGNSARICAGGAGGDRGAWGNAAESRCGNGAAGSGARHVGSGGHGGASSGEEVLEGGHRGGGGGDWPAVGRGRDWGSGMVDAEHQVLRLDGNGMG